MSTEEFIEYVKTNKRSVIKKSLIAVGVMAGLIFTAVLLKKDKDTTEVYLDAVENYLDASEDHLDYLIDDTKTRLEYAKKRIEDANIALDSIEN